MRSQNGETAFEVAREHRGALTASPIDITRLEPVVLKYQSARIHTNWTKKGCPYLHHFHLSKMVAIKCNLKTSVMENKFINVV